MFFAHDILSFQQMQEKADTYLETILAPRFLIKLRRGSQTYLGVLTAIRTGLHDIAFELNKTAVTWAEANRRQGHWSLAEVLVGM